MIIDTHTHFYNPSRPQGVPWPSQENQLLYRTVLPEHCKELAVPEGVTGTVVVEASVWLEDNQWILDLAAADPFIVGLVGHIDPNRPEFAAELDRFAANPLFRGIRCGGTYFDQDLSSSSFVADMEQLAARDLQLDVLVRSQHFDRLCQLAAQIPTLRIVVDHIAHMPIDGKAITAEWAIHYQQLAAQPNIFMKVSAVLEQNITQPAPIDLETYRPALDVLWNTFGEERLIYGSNWPVLARAGSYSDAINLVKAYFAEKGEAATAKYFWQNAKAVYKWGS